VKGSASNTRVEKRAHKGTGPSNRLALVSTPWPFFDRPSVQLGTLKAFLTQELKGVAVDTYHLYLQVAQALGFSLYKGISNRLWVAECPYAALLYPERMETLHRFWRREVRRDPLLSATDFEHLCQEIQQASVSLVENISWKSYALIGFSMCLAQLSSSLYFIRKIKEHAPRTPIVVGGSACAGGLGRSLMGAVPEIDYVIQGEGELPLLGLTQTLLGKKGGTPGPDLSGVVFRDGPQGSADHHQIPNLNDLPIPDYTDYFEDLKSSDPAHAFLPRLPMEISRGCWWRRAKSGKGEGGCAFCNLNLQWKGYRRKSVDRTVSEIETLAKRHQLLSVSFMDNLLPARDLARLFSCIQDLGMDLRLFSEIRAKTRYRVLKAMAGAGMQEVQVGVEALSTGLLHKLNKGTTAMDNLEIMKHCEQSDFPNLTGNLILEFPSSDEKDVAETLHNLDFALGFRPLKGIPLWLGYGSTVWQYPDQYGIRVKGNHPHYGHLFPEKLNRQVRFMMQGYHGGVRHQHRLWAPVREKLSQWRAFYEQIHQDPGFHPVLSYRDGTDFLIIHERRLHQDDMTHRLTGSSRSIYLFCETQRPLKEIVERFPRFGQDQILGFLRMMVAKRLMFNEEDRYLSLAVPN